MNIQILTNRQALAAIDGGAAVFFASANGLSRVAPEVAREICNRRSDLSADSPFGADAEGDLFYLGRHGDTISRNFKRICSLWAASDL